MTPLIAAQLAALFSRESMAIHDDAESARLAAISEEWIAIAGVGASDFEPASFFPLDLVDLDLMRRIA